MDYAIQRSAFSSQNAVERALMAKYPEAWRSPGFLSSYKTGRRGGSYPDPRAIHRIAGILGVSFEWLMVGTGPVSAPPTTFPPQDPMAGRPASTPRARGPRRRRSEGGDGHHR